MSVGLYIKRKGILDFVALAKAMPAYQFIWFGYLNLHQVPREIREAVETKLPNLQFAGYVAPDELTKCILWCGFVFLPNLRRNGRNRSSGGSRYGTGDPDPGYTDL